MMLTDFQPVAGDQTPQPARQVRVLVVDDSRFQRRVLAASLTKLGYAVTEAESGEEAVLHCARSMPDMVLSDWMMPGMSGLEFCEAFRAMSEQKYGYFIILTSKTEKTEIARGLDAGADDFLSKPVDPNELRARLNAGRRVLQMQRDLQRGNELLSDTLEELQSMYDSVDRDLQEAKTLQQSLLRDRHVKFDHAELSMMLRSSGHVGGDLVGHFPAGEGKLGLFAIDVSGHGISSALMTARLAGFLSATTPEHNVALMRNADGSLTPRPPDEVVGELNELVLGEMNTEHYFTLMLAIFDQETGVVTLSQAGHPHPIVQRANGRVEQDGTGGFPVGLLGGILFEKFEITLAPGDRLLILSDGVTECPNPTGQLLAEHGMSQMMYRLKNHVGPDCLDQMVQELADYAGKRDFPDDVSAILLEYSGPG